MEAEMDQQAKSDLVSVTVEYENQYGQTKPDKNKLESERSTKRSKKNISHSNSTKVLDSQEKSNV